MKLQEDEKIIHEMRPARAILVMWFFSKCILPAFVGVFITFWCFAFFGGVLAARAASDSPWPIVRALIAAPVVGGVVLFLALIYCVHLRRTYVYYVTNQRCVFHGGILRRVERSVPYHKVTDVETSQNIVERAFGISKLNIFTPGTASVMPTPFSPFGGQRAEISFVGLADSETPAETINEILRKFKATGE